VFVPKLLGKILSLRNKKFEKMTEDQFKLEATMQCLHDKSVEMMQNKNPPVVLYNPKNKAGIGQLYFYDYRPVKKIKP
jgi:hypothetical protein